MFLYKKNYFNLYLRYSFGICAFCALAHNYNYYRIREKSPVYDLICAVSFVLIKTFVRCLQFCHIPKHNLIIFCGSLYMTSRNLSIVK
jgi:hypothetical protein